MKKYLVIGNPINHSLSPLLHNYWFKKHEIKATYKKAEIENNDLENIITDVREEKIHGLNITVPFKKTIIPYTDCLTDVANITKSVNTIYKKNNQIIGDNTDVGGFELAIKKIKYDLKNKTVFILGAGGVVPSIVYALKKMEVSKIFLSNRTREKAENLKKDFRELEIIKWGNIPNFDVIINATSLGLNKSEVINLDYNNIGKNKLFYDVIYNPPQTNFLIMGKKFDNRTENGKMMFVYQAQLAFNIWHNISPQIDTETINLLNL